MLSVLVVFTPCEVLTADTTSCQSSAFVQVLQDTVDVAAHNEFVNFKTKYGKVYTDDEDFRFQIFSKTLERIKANNADRLSRGAEQTQGITKFSDLTEEEFKRRLGFKPSLRPPGSGSNITVTTECTACKHFSTAVEHALLNDEVNWVAIGAVVAVKDQGACGSCWAFSTIADVEGSHFMYYGDLEAYSEEQLVQCDDTDSGCDGGMMEIAMEYIMSVDGVDKREHYPYLTCSLYGSTYCEDYEDKCSSFYSGIGLASLGRLNGYYFISYADASAEPSIKLHLFKSGPLSCAINAYPMETYTGGVDDPTGCGNTFSDLNHGVAFVGFGSTSSGTSYWLIRNSWGSEWGMGGYYKIVYGSNACGVSLYVVHSVSY